MLWAEGLEVAVVRWDAKVVHVLHSEEGSEGRKRVLCMGYILLSLFSCNVMAPHIDDVSILIVSVVV